MTNNTINNVPRKLLADLLGNDHDKRIMAERHLLAMLANAPSPDGVDGLDTDRNAAFKACPESGCDWGSFYLGWKARGEVEQAIIDGLRGEVAELKQSAQGKLILRLYQHAQRIGELEGLLRAESARVDFLDAYIVTADAPDTGKAAMLADSGTLRECIDAALSTANGEVTK